MHKDELLQLHSLLCQTKRYFESVGMPVSGEFSEYHKLEVSPQHIHRSKTDHKRAVFYLAKGISQIIMQGTPDHQARLKERFLRLAATAAADEDEDESPTRTERDAGLPAFALAALRNAA